MRTVLVDRYLDFYGRARRSEYWWWLLAWSLAVVVTDALVYLTVALGSGAIVIVAVSLYVVVFFGGIVPTLAVTSRRLHDVGLPGWLQLINLVPVVGALVLVVLLTRDSKPGNRYGPSAKYPYGYRGYVPPSPDPSPYVAPTAPPPSGDGPPPGEQRPRRPRPSPR